MHQNIDELIALVDKFDNNLDYYHDNKKHYNEHSCRIEYIDPLLKMLGWDVSNEKGVAPQYREVIAENYSNETDRPDYSITLKGITKFFVEAKKPSVDISSNSSSAFQARKYGWNANHKIVVLINFEYLIIYDATFVPNINDNHTVALYRKYHFSEYVSKFREIEELLSRNNVYSGVFDEFCSKSFPGSTGHKQQVDDLFLEQINNWRVSLSNSLYQKTDKYYSMEKLNDVVQEFINQIVFLRICEDKNLPLYHKLKDTISNTVLSKEKLEELFRVADKRYNSGLFEKENIIFDLNNDIIIEIIESLYYPQSPYLFNIIEPNLLGKIYEAFLTEQLICSASGEITLAKKKECMNRSVVTTPFEIVKYIVAKTLGKLCNKKIPDEILLLKIADIACGSGVFLEEAYNYLVQYCVEWYSLNNPEFLIDVSGGRKKLPLEAKKEILLSCIYGIDIDIHAVEVTKFSLLIKLIEDETAPSVEASIPILPNLDTNITLGNSLIGKQELQREVLSTDEIIEIVPFDWTMINNGRNFDAIIGNPPYVSTEDMHALLNRREFVLYKKNYMSTYKQFDKYFLFIERALQKVSSRGYVCFIVPNKFFKISAGQKLRRLIASNKSLVSLDDFGDAQLFANKTIYSSILLLQKEINETFNYSKIKSAATLWSGEKQQSITLEGNFLNELPWRLTTDFEFLSLLKRLDKASVPISTHAEIFNGIQTSAERPKPIYWFTNSQIVNESDKCYTIQKDSNTFEIEKEIIRPYFKPAKKSEKGLNSYSIIQTDKWIIFPYDSDGNLISIEKMEKDFEGTLNYLKSYYDRLVPKQISPSGVRDVPNATPETWYQYGRTQALTTFTDTPKLIVGILSKEPMYAYDNKDMLIASGGTAGYCAITQKTDSPYALEYLQAWLSNPYTEKFIKTVGSDFENGFSSRGTFVLPKIPFIELDFYNPNQKAIYDNVVEDTRKVYAINRILEEPIEKRKFILLMREKEQLIKSIEGRISSVYRLEFQNGDKL